MARTDHLMLRSGHFKLGLFSANCSGGLAVTRVPERWDASWDSNLALSMLADDFGIDFMLPIARFAGYGGDTDFQGASLETLVWASALLASTQRMTVFATVHTAFCHPVLAAKQFATADQVGHGRFGLNIVAGWNQPEYELFGLELPPGHADRYAQAQEWWDVVRRIWTEDKPFDFQGRQFKLKNVSGRPRPFNGVPPILNAASSQEGRAFAAANVDFLFTVLIDLATSKAELPLLRAQSKAHGRELGVLTPTYVVCRPTKKEAEDYHRHYAEENADEKGLDRLLELQGLHAKSFPADAFKHLRTRFAGGHGSYPLIGDPDTVADEIEKIAAAGFDGATLAFVDYVMELPFFCTEVIPRLERKGLRIPLAR